MVLGLANDRWRAQADALGYERFFPMRRLVRILRPERLLARRARVPALAGLRGVGSLWNLAWDRAAPPEIAVRPLATASPEIDAVWQRAKSHVQTSLVRDRSWVTWRYCDCPYRTYHPRRGTHEGRSDTPCTAWSARTAWRPCSRPVIFALATRRRCGRWCAQW